MGQVLHGSARTTEAVRRAIQHSQASLRALTKRYGIHQKTVRKWKARDCVADLRTGPKEPRSTVLSVEADHLVNAVAGDRSYACIRLDGRSQFGRLGERLEISLVEVLAGRESVARRLLPAVTP
jgi:hypothetical protein